MRRFHYRVRFQEYSNYWKHYIFFDKTFCVLHETTEQFKQSEMLKNYLKERTIINCKVVELKTDNYVTINCLEQCCDNW